MATATAARKDLYLSILAGRVLTALADLSANPTAWNEDIRREIESGIEYCHTVRECKRSPLAVGPVERPSALNRLACDDARDLQPEHPPECDVIETLLRELIARERTPQSGELLDAIRFFSGDPERAT